MNKTFYLHIIVVNHGVYVHCLLFQKFPERRVGHSDFLFFSILHGFECCCTDHSVCSTYHLRRPRYKTLFFFFGGSEKGDIFISILEGVIIPSFSKSFLYDCSIHYIYFVLEHYPLPLKKNLYLQPWIVVYKSMHMS